VSDPIIPTDTTANGARWRTWQDVEMTETLRQLRRMRSLLWAMTIAAAALGWVTGPLLWALAVVFLILAVRNELLICRGQRYLDTVV
jgi:hypothetical protein